MKAMTRIPVIIAVVLSLVGCETLLSGFSAGSIFDTAVGAAMGDTESQQKMQSLQQAGEAVQSAAAEITPEQEYYIGRAVAATVLSMYKPWTGQKANEYLNTLGRSLSYASILPETFGGYHFLVMDTDDINAFGAPGGLVLVSRGLLRCAKSEDEVAAILAHEIGHVSLKHGLGAISAARWTDAALKIAKFGAENSDSALLRDLTGSFGGVISDIVKTMVTSGYSQALEQQADLEAVRILHDVGYDPMALARMLEAMKTKLKPDGKDFAKTHPSPEVRVAYVTEAVKTQTPTAAPSAAQVKARQTRYQAALSGI